MAEVFSRYPQGGGEFTLALALADNAHDDGTRIFPSVETMAHKSRQSVRAVQTHLRAMQASGWLVLVKSSAGRGRPTEYRISAAWLKGAELAPIPPAVDNGPMGAEPAPIPARKRVQNRAQKGAELDTPYKNRKNHQLTPPTPPRGDAPAKRSTRRECAIHLPPGLAAIADAYPRRAGMPRAAEQWRALAPSDDLQRRMVEAIAAWKRSAEWQRDEGRWVPLLWKWLRDKRWLDAPGMASAAAPVATVAPAVAVAPMPAEVRDKIASILGRPGPAIRAEAAA